VTREAASEFAASLARESSTPVYVVLDRTASPNLDRAYYYTQLPHSTYSGCEVVATFGGRG
jgi:hypothetical protein